MRCDNTSGIFIIIYLYEIAILGGWMGGGGVQNSVFNTKFRAYS